MKKILGVCAIYLLFYLFAFSNSLAATQNEYHIYLYDNFFTYSGNEICPEIQKVTVDTEDGEKILTQDTDYIVRYQNNVNAGEGTITVYGRGEYSGSESMDFTIYEKKLIHKNCKYEIIYSDFVPGEPTLQLYCDDILLYQNVDYEIEYKNNEKITDEAVLVVSGEGNYIGELTIPYQIPAKDLSRYGIVGEIEDMEYTGQLLFQSLDVHYVVNGNSEKLALNTDYNTSFSGNQEVGVCTVTITGCGNYTGSIYKTFRILPRDIEECSADEIVDSVYTTKEIRPQPVVTDGTKQLKYGVDYELSYQNHINAGEATVIVAGKGNYTGRLFIAFEILLKDIGRIKVENIVHKEYSGKERVQKFLQVPGLVKNRDYTVSYENNVDIGKALVILSGQGNYTGEREIAFRIVKKKKTCPAVKRFSLAKIKIQKRKYDVLCQWKESVGALGYEIYQKKSKVVTIKKKKSKKMVKRRIVHWSRVGTTNKIFYTIKNLKKKSHIILNCVLIRNIKEKRFIVGFVKRNY